MKPRPGRVLAGCLAILAFACSGPTVREQSPDVVMILIDTFRPDHLGINGYARRTAPFLEDLMTRSSVFGRALSTSSWTAPATGSLFTGLYPTHHGVTEGFVAHRVRSSSLASLVGQKIELNRLPVGVATLPELLRQAGYSTFGLATNVNIGSEIGFDRGFDLFRKLRDLPAEQVARVLSEWRDDIVASRPYFLYLHFNDVHEPYSRREPWYERGANKRSDKVSAYDSEISYLDGVLERLYRDFSWQRDTLLIVVSDHGEELGEHGGFGHGFSLEEELIRVLLVFAGADLGIPARALSVPVSLIDVLPTVLDLLAVPKPENIDGLSVARLLGPTARSPGVLPRRTLFAHRARRRARDGGGEQHLWAAVRMPWKLVGSSDELSLFDLSSDSARAENLVAEQPVEVRELGAELVTFQRSASERIGERFEIELDQGTIDSLEALGYIQ